LRQCSRGRAQQQRHCHDKFCCTHGWISSRLGSIARMAAIAWLCCLFLQVIHKILLDRLAIIRRRNDGCAALP
jgi:hypothetical protein